MQALLNPLYVDGDMNRVQTIVSELHSIFNAIKRAEDAHDVQMTAVSFVFSVVALFAEVITIRFMNRVPCRGYMF